MNVSPVVVSVVLPCFNEAANLPDLFEEIRQALEDLDRNFEVLFVDDGSTDDTRRVVEDIAKADRRVRLLRHGANLGQSAAIATGFRESRGMVVATLDADGQNDPADLPLLLRRLLDSGADAVTGLRSRRMDHWVRKVSSRVANAFRNIVTGDRVVDSGCGMRAVRREALLEVPVFRGMHRFLPTLLRAQGFSLIEMEVRHRPRRAGVSKYGVHNRLWRGILDCIAVRWYKQRALPSHTRRIRP